MPNIDLSPQITAINNAVMGRDAREAFVSALETIQTAVNALAPATLLTGSEKIVIENATPVKVQVLTLPITPTASTRIVAGIRSVGSSTPTFNFGLAYSNGRITAEFTRVGESIPAGTYYIDWIITGE